MYKRETECRCCDNNKSSSERLLSCRARLLSRQTVAIRSQHDDPRATTGLSGSWRWAIPEFLVDDKDGAIEPSGVMESPER